MIIPAMSLRYPVPAARHRAEIFARRSRFITSAAPTATVAEARAFIDEIRAEFPDAGHHVYAFVVGHGGSVIQGMSDDGEPAGTAGRPTLAVVAGSGLGDLCLVTTRYFGGTKLGTGGLVKAYTQAAQALLEGLPRGLFETTERVSIQLTYAQYEAVKRLCEAHAAEIEDEDFGSAITLRARVAVDRVDALAADLAEASAGSVELLRVEG